MICKRGVIGLIVILSFLLVGCSLNNSTECVKAGCSGEICTTSEKAKDLFTTCEYKEEYRCLQYSQCKAIGNECKWEETQEYLDCLKEVK